MATAGLQLTVPPDSHILFRKETWRYFRVLIDIENSKAPDGGGNGRSRIWTFKTLCETGVLNFPYYLFPDLSNDSDDEEDYVIHLRSIIRPTKQQIQAIEALPYVHHISIDAVNGEGQLLDHAGNTLN